MPPLTYVWKWQKLFDKGIWHCLGNTEYLDPIPKGYDIRILPSHLKPKDPPNKELYDAYTD